MISKLEQDLVHGCITADRSTEAFRSLTRLQDIHKNLERKLAEFHEREDCILYASCFDANAGLFEVTPPYTLPSKAENPKPKLKNVIKVK